MVAAQDPPDIVALVLAAGVGHRFDPTGERFKLVQRLSDGRPIVRAACEAALQCVPDVRVIYGHHRVQVLDALKGLPVCGVACPNATLGMGATIKAGIQQDHPRFGWIILLGDMPYVETDTIMRICTRLRSGALAVRPFFQGLPGHPVGLSISLRSSLLGMPDNAGGISILPDLVGSVERLESHLPGCRLDIDTSKDLDRLLS